MASLANTLSEITARAWPGGNRTYLQQVLHLRGLRQSDCLHTYGLIHKAPLINVRKTATRNGIVADDGDVFKCQKLWVDAHRFR